MRTIIILNMPIIDYAEKAEQSLLNLYADPAISETNKKYIRRFEKSYSVSNARRNLFFLHIKRFLRVHPDAHEFVNSRDKVNTAYAKWRKELSPASYATIVNISKRFARWINDDELPKGMKDIKTPSKKSQKRKLDPEDMLTWDDGLKLAGATNSVQIKAAILTQLDAGLRPSEFIDLTFGDVRRKDPFLILRIKEGKTGTRDVILYHAVPYLLKWLENHPTKKKDSPLWVKESGERVEAYNYPAILSRIKKLAVKVDLAKEIKKTKTIEENGKKKEVKYSIIQPNKPLSLYNLRHSAATIAKKDNIPTDEGAKKFGHSVAHFTDTYGRLDLNDQLARLSHAYGLKHEEEEQIPKNRLCSRCETVNAPETNYCHKCGTPLTLEQAIKDKRHEEKTIQEMGVMVLGQHFGLSEEQIEQHLARIRKE